MRVNGLVIYAKMHWPLSLYFHKYLPSTDLAPGPVSGAKERASNQSDKNFNPQGALVWLVVVVEDKTVDK